MTCAIPRLGRSPATPIQSRFPSDTRSVYQIHLQAFRALAFRKSGAHNAHTLPPTRPTERSPKRNSTYPIQRSARARYRLVLANGHPALRNECLAPSGMYAWHRRPGSISSTSADSLPGLKEIRLVSVAQVESFARRSPVNCQRELAGKKLRYVARMCESEVAHEPPRSTY